MTEDRTFRLEHRREGWFVIFKAPPEYADDDYLANACEVWLWQERERLLASNARMTNAIRGLQQLQVGQADEADVMGSLASAADDLVAADQWLHERDAFIAGRAVQAYREQSEQPVDGTEAIRLDGRDGRDGA